MINYKTNNYFYSTYGKVKEQRVFEKLIEDGFTEEEIEKYRAKGLCIGCGSNRESTHQIKCDGCQCGFTGSAHPSDEEHYEYIKGCIRDKAIGLKLCPLCGGKANMVIIEPHKHYFVEGMLNYNGGVFIECLSCGLALSSKTEKQVTSIWNKRV